MSGFPYLQDGFSSRISFQLDPSSGLTHLYEKEVTPPGYDAAGMIDVTTMHNIRWRTRSPKALVTGTDVAATVAYGTQAYQALLSMLGTNQTITFTFPDTHTVVVWGWLNEFKPGALKEGEMPLADVSIIVSNHDNSGTEVAPVWA